VAIIKALNSTGEFDRYCYRWIRATVTVGFIFGCSVCVIATDSLSQLTKHQSELVETGGVVQLPGLTIFSGSTNWVEATGKVSITNGILEFLAVEHTGRGYESAFSLDCRPSALQYALLLIGCPTNVVANQIRPTSQSGDPLEIEVKWELGGKKTHVPVEKLLIDRNTGSPPNRLPWVYTGSYFVKNPVTQEEDFLADAEQAFISLWWHPGILINVGSDFGNPYQGDTHGFRVNTALIPPKDTPVTLIFRQKK